MKRNPVNRPVSVSAFSFFMISKYQKYCTRQTIITTYSVQVNFPRYGSSPTGGNTIVLLDLMGLNENDEGRYTCFAENKYGSVMSHGWLKFVKGKLALLAVCGQTVMCLQSNNHTTTNHNLLPPTMCPPWQSTRILPVMSDNKTR